MFYTSSTTKSKSKKTRLYCMEITTGDKTYYKFGKSSGISSKDRMLQIIGSYYDVHRETPIVKIVRDRPIDKDLVFKYETVLHQYFNFYQYSKKLLSFSGSTECFHINKDIAVLCFEQVIEGLEPDEKEPYMKDCDTIPF